MIRILILLVSFISFSPLSALALTEEEYLERLTKAHRQTESDKKFVLFEELVKDSDRYERFTILAATAKAAFSVDNYTAAKSYAIELLEAAQLYVDDWNYGNAIHDGNMVLGLIAVNDGDISLGADDLLKAGNTPGSPQIDSFGPNMALAKVLLENGESKTVLEYFKLCKKFWKLESGRLDNWAASVRGGGKPDFGANLVY